MDLETIDWAALERLRAGFLQRSAGAHDYWRTVSDLASYDQTFAQRIGWKWDYVLNQLSRRGWVPPTGVVLDWGCGSGIAGRACLHHFGLGAATRLILWDRSRLAMEFARGRAEARFPGLQVDLSDSAKARGDVVLLSHVLSELDDNQQADLLSSIAQATAVVWVESGDRETSRRLSSIRDRLADPFNIVAPCTHRAACGMLAPGNEAHWCHHFATPPPHVFTDGNWARFAALAGIDLRSLPLSFLVLDRRPVPEPPAGAVRVIGQPRLYKGYALMVGCTAAGIAERRLTKRHFNADFRQLKKGRIEPLQVWECEGEEIVKARPL
jgi:SAM-dependent methyltransferase